MARKREWSRTIDRLNRSKAGRLKIQLSSPNVAQVTRVRLLQQYDGLFARTEGATLTLSLSPIS